MGLGCTHPPLSFCQSLLSHQGCTLSPGLDCPAVGVGEGVAIALLPLADLVGRRQGAWGSIFTCSCTSKGEPLAVGTDHAPSQV